MLILMFADLKDYSTRLVLTIFYTDLMELDFTKSCNCQEITCKSLSRDLVIIK